MFASQITKVVQIAGAGVFTIRKLNRKRMNEAASAVFDQTIANAKKIGTDGAAAIKGMREAFKTEAAEAKRQLEAEKAATAAAEAEGKPVDLFGQYDRTTLIRHGVVAWPDGRPTPTLDQIEDLDDSIEEPLAREIYELSRPRTEEERKKA